MLDSKEIQKRVRANFQNILDAHAAKNQPVVVKDGNNIINIYKDGRKENIATIIKAKKIKITSNEFTI